MGILWTLRARGVVPSLGAGGALVVAALCCLLLAGALMTFRDWPGGGAAAPEGTIAMPAVPAGKAAGRTASGPSAPVVAPIASRPSGERVVRRDGDRRAPAARRRPVPASTNPPGAGAPVAAPAPAVQAPAPPPPAPSAPAAAAPRAPAATPAPVAPVTDPVEETVEQVREQAGRLPLPPVVRQPVQPVLDRVQPVLDTVQQAAEAVDGVTGRLPTLP